jgi:hypothetical protein
LEKVLEALGMVQSTVDACVTGVMPPSTDVWYTHATLRARGKRKATQEELRMVPLKKTCASKPFKELDNMINTSVKTPSVPRRDGSKRLAPNVVTPKSNAPIPTLADGKLFEIMELMKVLESCPMGAMKKWCTEWKKKNYVHVGYEQITRKFQIYNDGKKVKPNWGQTGQPMIVDHDRLNKKVAEKLQVQGQAVGTKMIAELVSEVQKVDSESQLLPTERLHRFVST